MQTEHKKALAVIFSILFVCLFIGTIIVTLYTHNLAISGVLMAVSTILAVDIIWVIRGKNNASTV